MVTQITEQMMNAVAAALAPVTPLTEREQALKIAHDGLVRQYGPASGLPQLHWIGEQWAAGNKVTREDADRHFGVTK